MGDGVREVAAVRLDVDREPWPYAVANRDAIAADWERCSRDNPRFFNGTVCIARAPRLEVGLFAARLARTDFASYLHWRTAGYPGGDGDHSILGAAALLAADGRIILARQQSGQLNSGLLAFIGGLIDDRDCLTGQVDIDAQIRREIAEETGLTADGLDAEPGYLIVEAGRVIAVVARLRSPLSGAELEARIRTSLAGEADGELADVIAVGAAGCIARERLAPYARLLVGHLLARGA